jgi:hypothetical protein
MVSDQDPIWYTHVDQIQYITSKIKFRSSQDNQSRLDQSEKNQF